MPDDLFSKADDEKLRLAGWWPTLGMPGYWTSPDGEILSVCEALSRIDQAAGSGQEGPGPAGE